MMKSSIEMSTMPMDMPDFMGMACRGRGRPRNAAKAVREFAKVLMRIPYHATAYEPAMPSNEKATMMAMRDQLYPTRTLK